MKEKEKKNEKVKCKIINGHRRDIVKKRDEKILPQREGVHEINFLFVSMKLWFSIIFITFCSRSSDPFYIVNYFLDIQYKFISCATKKDMQKIPMHGKIRKISEYCKIRKLFRCGSNFAFQQLVSWIIQRKMVETQGALRAR